MNVLTTTDFVADISSDIRHTPHVTKITQSIR